MKTRGCRLSLQLAVALVSATCSAQPAQKAPPRKAVPPDTHVITDLVTAERFLISTDTRAFAEVVPDNPPQVRLVADSAGCRLELVIGGLLGGQVQAMVMAEDSEMLGDPTSKIETEGGKIVLGRKHTILFQDWFDGAEHTFRGDVRLGSYLFKSDPNLPLTFQLVKGMGYVYLSGRGSVQKDGAEAVSLGKDQIASDWLGRLKSGTALEKQGAAIALGWYKDKKVIPELIVAAKDTSSWKVRRDAVEALGRIGDAAAVTALAEAVGDENPWVGAVALEALGRTGRPGLPHLEKSLAGEERLRKGAVYGLGFSPTDEAVGLLAKVAADTKTDLRKAAIRALGRLGRPAAAAPLLAAFGSETDDNVRAAAVGALSGMQTPECFEAVLGAAKDKATEVRRATITALARSKDPRAVAALESMAASDPDKDVKEAAREAIKKLKTGSVGDSTAAQGDAG